MILFDPAGRITACSEAARVVDSVFLIMNDNDVILEDGEGNIVVFRTQSRARKYRSDHLIHDPGDLKRWGIYEIFPRDLDTMILNHPHTCIGE